MLSIGAQTPLMVRFLSMMATFLRSLAAQMAPFCPADPLPITINSYSFASIVASFLIPNFLLTTTVEFLGDATKTSRAVDERSYYQFRAAQE